MNVWIFVALAVVGCSRGDNAKESRKGASATGTRPVDGSKFEALTADFKAWVARTYTSEPHKLTDLAGREKAITCKIETSIDSATLEGVLQATATIADRSYPVAAIFQKGDAGWMCKQDDPKEEVKWSALNCETVEEYCSRNPPPPKVTSLWEYSEKEDKMRGTKTKLATIKSLNEIPVSFPTRGMTKLEMLVRQEGGKQDVFLRATNGALDPCTPQCTIAAKFGDGAVVAFTAYPPSGIPGSAMFVANAARWLKLMKAAKLAVVEVNLFEGGRQQFEFAVVGLDWPR